MKKVLLAAMLLNSVILSLLLPVTWRAKLSRPLAAMLGGMREHVPDE